MRIVFMNAPILTAEGKYSYNEYPVDVINNMLRVNKDAERISAIGHEAVAEVMSEKLKEKVKMNRIDFKMMKGDIAIVLKLNRRGAEGKILDRKAMDKIGYKFYMLRRTS